MSTESEGRAAAERFRRDQHLAMQPLGDLVTIIEQATGIDVAVLHAEQEEHGLTMRDPKRGAVFIAVACTRNPMRQRSTLAHELGHVLFEDWAETEAISWRDRSPEETRADAFARHVLLPTAGLDEFLTDRETVTEADLSAIVQRFLVSPAIAAIALCQAGYINAATKREWTTLTTPQLAIRFGWSDQYRALQIDAERRRAPQRLLARAIRGYAEGVLSVQAVANLRGITQEEAEEELQEAGVVSAGRPVAWSDPTELPDAEVDLEALDAVLNAPDEDLDPSDVTADNG